MRACPWRLIRWKVRRWAGENLASQHLRIPPSLLRNHGKGVGRYAAPSDSATKTGRCPPPPWPIGSAVAPDNTRPVITAGPVWRRLVFGLAAAPPLTTGNRSLRAIALASPGGIYPMAATAAPNITE